MKIVISNILEILGLQPPISEVFLDHQNIFFSQQVRTILVTKYQVYVVSNSLFFDHLFQYAIVSGVIFMVVQTIRKTPWNSIDEKNTLDNLVLIQGNVTVLFMSFIAFWKFLIPFKKYAMSIPTSEESNPSIEKTVKIEIEPP